LKEPFANEPDTDLDLPWNREWALTVLNKWKTEVNATNFVVPVQIGDKEVLTMNKRTYTDRSRENQVVVCEANLSTQEQIEEILAKLKVMHPVGGKLHLTSARKYCFKWPKILLPSVAI